MQILALLIFIFTYALIIFRRFRGVEVPVWTAMLIGAALMVVSRVISIDAAYAAVNMDVIIFLFGMFTIVAGMEYWACYVT